jgi:hypothetical protein
MSTSLIIPKDPVYPASMDWLALRREGIGHIENLASDIWTDYNLHDPGITILEILCYAITDLGYRSNFAPADLFASPNKDAFYTAAQMLPCAPVTALDIRKILVDIPGVHNAWVEQLDKPEVRFFWPLTLQDTFARQTLQPYIDLLNLGEIAFPTPPDIDVDLLNKIYICQSDKDRQTAQLAFRDKMLAEITDVSNGIEKVMLVYMLSNYYDEVVFFLENLLPLNTTGNTNTYQLEQDIPELLNYIAELRTQLVNQQTPNSDTLANAIGIITNEAGMAPFFYTDPLLCLYFAGSLQTGEIPEKPAGTDYNLFIPQGIYSVTLRLEDDQDGNEPDIIAEAKRRLHKLRNLNEDIAPDIHIAETVNMGIDLAVEIDPTQDKWEVLSNIYRAIDDYFSPDVTFYSLEEMMNRYAQFQIDDTVITALQTAQLPDNLITALQTIKDQRFTGDAAFKAAIAGVWSASDVDDYYNDVFVQANKYYNADPVYKGPLLQNGFIDEAELVLAQPRQTIYRSDLYQIVAGVTGVQEVNRLDMYVCQDDGVKDDAGRWCIALDCKCLPKLNDACSAFATVSNNTELPIDMLKLKEYMDVHPEATTKINRADSLDLPLPTGRIINDLADFTSTQMDFPRTYKIGTTGISRQQPDLRQAQAKQLKGYLFFFDQLLGNYLAHLSAVKDLFSVKGVDVNIYQPMYSIPGIKEILLDYKGLQDGETAPEGQTPPTWDDFIAGDNDYTKILLELTAGNDTDRKLYRDQLLDHMLARFGEAFTDYATQLYRIERPLSESDVWEVDEGLDQDIADKLSFMQQLPDLGAKRATGFVYFYDKDEYRYWKTDNVEGVRKRTCAILGMQDATRHTITCEPAFDVGIGEVDNLGAAPAETRYEFYVKAKDPGKPRLLVSTEKFKSYDTAKKARLDFLKRAGDSTAYGVINDNLVGFWLNTVTSERTADNALLLEPGEGADGADKRLQSIKDLATGNCNDDSFHLLEHILLRPRDGSYSQMLRPMLCCTDDLQMLDPYSFWMTVVLPDWAGRFSDPDRLDAFMQTLRREMPAHLAVRYVLLSRADMLAFETVYNEWIKRLCTQPQDLAETNDALTTLMNNWTDNQIHYF